MEYGKCYSKVWTDEDTCSRENLEKMDNSKIVPWHFPDDGGRDAPWNFGLLAIQKPDASVSPRIFCYILILSTSLALDSRLICCFDSHQPFLVFHQWSDQLAWCFRFLWPCIVSKVWRDKTNKMQQLNVYYQLLSQHYSAHFLQDSALQPLPTTSSRTRTIHQMQ